MYRSLSRTSSRRSSDWEERERLSAALEAERQKNLSASLTTEIASIREAKAAALRRKQDLEEQRRALVEREQKEGASYKGVCAPRARARVSAAGALLLLYTTTTTTAR